MTAHDIRARVRAGYATVGTWLQLPSADVAELMARAGYDWVAIDMEHGGFGRTGLADICRAIECGGAAPFARVAHAGKVHIKAALDAGAQGLIFPMIESRAQLDEAIAMALYPGLVPDIVGQRGVGYCRANVFGRDFDTYRQQTATDIFLVAQIEHIRAVEHVDAILAHPRLDAIMVGPYDLSGSMGITGQFDHPDFIAALECVRQACKNIAPSTPAMSASPAMGLHIVQPDPAALAVRIAEGYRFIAYGIDAVFLWQGAKRPLVRPLVKQLPL